MAKKPKKPAGKKSLKAGEAEQHQAEKTFGANPPNFRGFTASLSKLGRFLIFVAGCVLIVVVALSTASALVGSVLGVALPLALTSGMAYIPGILANKFAHLPKRRFDRFLQINIPLTSLLFGLLPFVSGIDVVAHGENMDWMTTVGFSLLLFGSMLALLLITITRAGYYAREKGERRVFYAAWVVMISIFILITGPWTNSLQVLAGILVLLTGLYGLLRWSVTLGFLSEASFANSCDVFLAIGLGDLFLLLITLTLRWFSNPFFTMLAIAVDISLMWTAVAKVAKIKSIKRLFTYFTLVMLGYYAVTVCVYSVLLAASTTLVVIIPLISTSVTLYAPLGYAAKNLERARSTVQKVISGNTALLATGILLLPASVAIEIATHQIYIPLAWIVASTAFISVGITSFFYRRSGLQGSPGGRVYTKFTECAGAAALIASLFVLRSVVQSVPFLVQMSIIGQIAFYVFGTAFLAPVAFPYSQLSKRGRQVLAIAISLGVAASVSIFTYLVITTYGPLGAMLDVAFIISFDFGILLVFVALNLLRGQISKSIRDGAGWVWVLVPVINVTTIYRLFAPIDTVTTPLSLLGVVDVSGAWAVTVIVSTLLYLPLARSKSKKGRNAIPFVLWVETVTLLAWISFNFFAENTFNSWGFLVMTAIGLLMPLAYRANTWKLLSTLLLAFGVVSAFCVPVYLMELGAPLYNGLTVDLVVVGGCILGYTFVPGRQRGMALRINAFFLVVGGIFFLTILSFGLIPSFEYFGAFTAFAIAAGLCFIARRRGLLKSISERMLWMVTTGGIALSISDLFFILWQANFVWLGFTFTTIMVAFLFRYLASSKVAWWIVMPLPVTFFVQGIISLSLFTAAVLVSAWIVTYLTAFLVLTNILKVLVKQRRVSGQKNVLPPVSHVSLTPATNLTLWSIDALVVSLWVAISSKGTWANQFLIFGIIFFFTSVMELLIIRRKYPKIGHLLHALGNVLMSIGILAVALESATILGIHILIILMGWVCWQLYTNRVIFSTIRAFIDKVDLEKGVKAKKSPFFRSWERCIQALIVYATLLLFAEYLVGLILPVVHLERIITGTVFWSQLLVFASVTHFLVRLDPRVWKLLPSRYAYLLLQYTGLGVLLGLIPWEYALVAIALPVLPLIATLILAEIYYLFSLIDSIWEGKIHVESFRYWFYLALEINLALWPLYFASFNVNQIIPLIIGSAAIFLGMTFIDERIAPAHGQQVRLALRRTSFLVLGGAISFETFLYLFIYSVEIRVTVALLVFAGFCTIIAHPFRKHSPLAVTFWYVMWLLFAGIIYYISSSVLVSSIIILTCSLIYILIFVPSIRDRLWNYLKRAMAILGSPFHQISDALTRLSHRVSLALINAAEKISKALRSVAEKLAAYWRNHAVSLWILFSIMCGIGLTLLLAVNGEYPVLNSFSVGLVIFFLLISGIFPLAHPTQISNKIKFRKKALYIGGLYWSFSWAVLGFFPFNVYVILGDILLFGVVLLSSIHQTEHRLIISFKWRFGVTFGYVVLICITIASILWIASGLMTMLVFLTIATLSLSLFLAMVFKAPAPVIDTRFGPATNNSPHPPAIPSPDLLMQFFANATHTTQLASMRKTFSQQQNSTQFLHGMVRALIILLLHHTRALGKVILHPSSIAITIMAIITDIIGFHFDAKELGDFIIQKIQTMRHDRLLGENKGKLFLTRQGMEFFKKHA